METVAQLRDENSLLSDTLEVLTIELAKRKPTVDVEESIVEAVTP